MPFYVGGGMSDLAAFLKARLDEEEAAAKAALTYDPARVLREVEAKRQLIELADHATQLDVQVDQEFRIETRDEADEPYAGDLILRQLAAVYSDHPDYRDEWSA